MNEFNESLRPTIFLDLDGTCVIHGTNVIHPLVEGYLIKWHDSGIRLVFTTSRLAAWAHKVLKPWCISWLRKGKVIKYDLVSGLPRGQRIVVNDIREGEAPQAVGVNTLVNSFDWLEKTDEALTQ